MRAFEREAAGVLQAGGYSKARLSGKEHGVWTHPDPSRPEIHVPGTPRDPDHALIRIRRAVRNASTPHGQTGVEAVTPPKMKPKERTEVEKMLRQAPAALTRRARDISANPPAPGERSPGAAEKDVARWLRSLVDANGAISNVVLSEAAAELYLNKFLISAARGASGMVTYKRKGADRFDTYTDYLGRVEKDETAMILGSPGKKRGAYKKPTKPAPVKTSFVEPTAPAALPVDPDEVRGRRLDQGGLTPAQHAEAERLMHESSKKADAEAAELRARLAELKGDNEPGVQLPGNGNGNGKPKSQLEIAMQLLQEAALADTHALTDEDLLMLRGTADNLKRIRSDLDGMAAGINTLLRRVDTRSGVAAA